LVSRLRRCPMPALHPAGSGPTAVRR
jgi:hypothetical protein